ncbi:3-deoxy-manno-octulosonate cytidylyltransferase [Phycisphaerae bacterium RAS1]|nr:3-deoxy-manno-octulosonate cytidylyltransferase [Phycisphaerae bacterium RAS1]
MKIVATIEARMGSSRLPGKSLTPILGRPMLELLIERLRRSRRVQQVVVATTTAPEDAVIQGLAQKLEVGCFRGSSDDVLDRVLQAATRHKADLIVEITGDCPLIDPQIVDQVVETFLRGEYDYVSNTLQRTYPRGLDTQVFPTRVLAEVAALTQDPADREHVSLYIYEHPERYRLGNVAAPAELHNPDMRWTVDTPEDLALITSIYERLYRKNPGFASTDVMNLLNTDRNLASTNAHVRQKPVR